MLKYIPFRKVLTQSLALLLFCLLEASVVFGANQYRIEVDSDQKLNVRGTVTLTWHNETGQPVSNLPLICSGKIKGAWDGAAPLKVSGNAVLLPRPVPNNDVTTLRISFETHSRGAYGYRVLMDAWHPKALTFRHGIWSHNQRQADDYEVTITAPASLIIASAGSVAETSPLSSGNQKRSWRLQGATSFGLAASTKFKETSRDSEGIQVRLFQLPGEDRFESVMADYAVEAIAFYKKIFGFYPHPALVMLPGQFSSGGGYAPASGFTIFHNSTGEWRRWIVAHEIAHQYWGFDTIIDDGDYCHWMGIGLGIYSDQLYMSSLEPPGLRFNTGSYFAAASKGLDTTIRKTNQERKTLKYDWNNAVCHAKSYQVVQMLADMVGPDRFMQILLRILDQFRNQYLSFEQFQAAVEAVAEQKLDWFFHDWVETDGRMSYAIAAVNAHNGAIDVQVRSTGTARFPLEVQVNTEDGAQIVKRISPQSEVQTLNFITSSPPTRIELDPKRKCPLIRDGKEVWRAPK